MAVSIPGSQVILCTDGLANIGVGALDQEAPANDAAAVSINVVVSIVSTADDDAS